jgi:ABC-type multidrug transport system ATPase subunit/pSer/pThr/pTyr-binding forkhead associated (FHA) protein
VAGILYITGRGGVEEFLLSAPVATIGRSPECDLRLDHPVVSWRHARVDVAGGATTVSDLGSSNGTYVNGVELAPREPRKLVDGDGVRIGPFVLAYRAQVGVTPAAVAGDRMTAAVTARPAQTIVLAPSEPASLVVSAPSETVRYELSGDTVTLGRGDDNDIVVTAGAVSGHHARLERRDGSWSIIDLGSTNGLYLEGHPVRQHVLRDGDLLTIGSSVAIAYTSGDGGQATPSARPEGTIDVPAGGELVIGRGSQAGLQVAHPQASTFHARVAWRDGRLVVEDLGSAAGTYVNGRRIQGQTLAEGDVVRIASRQLRVRDGRLEMVDEEGALELEAQHLSVTVAKGKRILDDVSLTIRPRQFVAVVGGSGAGKSTLVNALCGFRPATEGTVLVNGVDLYRNAGAYRTELGYVPQDDIIHRELPVRRALEYAARLRLPPDTTSAERRARIQEVLSDLDLLGCAETPVRQLSGGQRKRVSIAVELLTRPSLFFLDEATSGLDPATETQLMKLLRRLADQGRTIALITHATKNVMLCDVVVVMARGGRLAYAGPPDEALRFFGVRDFDEIYEKLDERPPERWTQGGHDDDAADREGGRRKPSRPTREGPAQAPPAQRRVSSFSQFLTLSQRYLDIIQCDRKSAALLLLIAPVIGALNFIEWPRTMFDPEVGSATKAVTFFFISALITLLVGTITSVREIVKESAIYRRERMVGVRVLPYVASKVAVGLLFALWSAGVLYGFMLAAVDLPQLHGLDFVYLFVPFLLGTFSGLAWGLLVSALAPTEDRAMLLIILVLVPQFVFSGGMIPVDDLGTPGKVIGSVTSTRWELGAMVTSAKVQSGPGKQADLSDTTLPGIRGMKTVAEKQSLVKTLHSQYGEVFSVRLSLYWGVCAAIAFGLLALVLILQKRKDRLLT